MKTFSRIVSLLFVATLLSGCASQQAGGLGKPTIYTSPPKYLETVGLNEFTKDEVLAEVGVPDKKQTLRGQDHWSYELGESAGERTYTYIFEDDELVNVRYNDQGPYNGTTAREAQAEQ